jgi:[acyl-carrier-protein] S-malonyltransferase
MMKPARDEMTPLLTATKFKDNGTKIIPNLTAQVTTTYGADFLIKQIDSPVKWTQTIEVSHQSGMTSFVEIGPGKVLFGLARRILPKGDFKLVQTDNIKEFLGS